MYIDILMAISHGMSLTIAAIHELQPEAIIVQAEVSSSNVTDISFPARRNSLPLATTGEIGNISPSTVI
jgi:hypothetical protein